MASAAPAPDYLVLGHLRLDQTPYILSDRHRDGPSAAAASEPGPERGQWAHAALTARALGRRPAIVTSAGDDSNEADPVDGTDPRPRPDNV
jgi:hypothetical protein